MGRVGFKKNGPRASRNVARSIFPRTGRGYRSPVNTRPSLYRWHHELKRLFNLALERYRAGERRAEQFFDAAGHAYLASIGMSAQELFDFAEDHVKYGGDPDWETVLLITAARRDYFLTVLHGQPARRTVDTADLPPKKAQLDGFPWLPRLIQKAHAKLRGEMSADLMYGCGGDRRFFHEHGLHPADFLRHVWAADGDEAKILAFVRGQR